MEDEKLEVICDDLSLHPHCEHGPTLLFRKFTSNYEIIEEYFACSAYRSVNGCKFHLKKSNFDPNKVFQRGNSILIDKISKIQNKIWKTSYDQRCFCHECGVLFKKKRLHSHDGHDVQIGISDHLLENPTKLIRPLSNNKAEAQYFFSENTLDFLIKLFKDLNINKVCCIGAPRLHERLKYLYSTHKIKSFLLDIDQRLAQFFDINEFAHFNMFNMHFFEGDDKRELFEKFLKVDNDDNVLLFIDPPFGCRTEPLVKTIREISTIFKNCNSDLTKILPILWIFPYFMEQYIKKFMPEMEICDYKVNYDNHLQYSNNHKYGRKQGSPVRIFTNISLDLIKLISTEGYKYCTKCNKWTGIENLHCDICKKCPSKNGETYRHCMLCESCVKPKYHHCYNCGHCISRTTEHQCDEYQKNLTCWICRQHGHTEQKCDKWLKICKYRYKTHRNIIERSKQMAKNQGIRLCLICAKSKHHNEKNCPKRRYFLKERKFLSNYLNIFKTK